MILETGADDLPFVVEIFRADKSDDAVHKERLENAGHSVGACLERKLINAVMRLGRKCAPLAGFEVHRVVAFPCDIAPSMVLQYLLPPRTQSCERNPEAAVGRLGARDRLK